MHNRNTTTQLTILLLLLLLLKDIWSSLNRDDVSVEKTNAVLVSQHTNKRLEPLQSLQFGVPIFDFRQKTAMLIVDFHSSSHPWFNLQSYPKAELVLATQTNELSIGSLVELPFWVVGVQAKNGLAFTVELTVAGRSRMPGI